MDHLLEMEDTLTQLANCHDDATINEYVSLCKMHQSLSEKLKTSNSAFITFVNKNLQPNGNNVVGVIFLKEALHQCNQQIFSEFALSWLKQVANLINHRTSPQMLRLICSTLNVHLKYSANSPEICKQVGPIVSTLTMSLIKFTNENIVLDTLSEIMKLFGSFCGSNKTQLEQFLCKMMSENVEKRKISKCFISLSTLGTSGQSGVNYQKSWTEYCERILGSTHLIIDSLFENIEELRSYESSLRLTNIEHLAEKGISLIGTFHKKRIVDKLCHCLGELLTMPCNFSKPVPVGKINALVCRILSVTSEALKKKSGQQYLGIISILPDLHISAINLLNSLALSCRESLLQCVDVVNKVILQTLTWTKNSRSSVDSNRKPCSDVRVAVYRLVYTWCNIVGSSCCLNLCAKEIFPQILSDVIPPSRGIKLVQKFQQGKGKRKKNKFFSRLEQDCLKKVDKEADAKLANAAFNALKSIFEACGSMIKPVLHKMVQNPLLLLAFKIVSEQEARLVPFDDACCRMKLLNCISVSFRHDNHLVPNTLQLCTCLFSAYSVHDSCIQVRMVAKNLLSEIEARMHADYPTLISHISLSEFEKIYEEVDEDASEVINSENEIMNTLPISENISDQKKTLNLSVVSLASVDISPDLETSSPNSRTVLNDEENIVSTPSRTLDYSLDTSNELKNGVCEKNETNLNDCEKKGIASEQVARMGDHSQSVNNQPENFNIENKVKNNNLNALSLEKPRLTTVEHNNSLSIIDEPVPKKKKLNDVGESNVLDDMLNSFVDQSPLE